MGWRRRKGWPQGHWGCSQSGGKVEGEDIRGDRGSYSAQPGT